MSSFQVSQSVRVNRGRLTGLKGVIVGLRGDRCLMEVEGFTVYLLIPIGNVCPH
jgi:hypothetical protein